MSNKMLATVIGSAVLVAAGIGTAVVVLTHHAATAQRDRGLAAQVQADLRVAATAEETYLTDNNTYTTSVTDLESEGFTPTAGDTIRVVSTDGYNGYCLAGSASGIPTYYYDSANGGITSVPCH